MRHLQNLSQVNQIILFLFQTSKVTFNGDGEFQTFAFLLTAPYETSISNQCFPKWALLPCRHPPPPLQPDVGKDWDVWVGLVEEREQLGKQQTGAVIASLFSTFQLDTEKRVTT